MACKGVARARKINSIKLAGSKVKTMSAYIDAHSHIWTPDTGHYPLAPGFRRANMEPPSFTVQELSGGAKPSGVNRVVLIQMSFYGHDNSYICSMRSRCIQVRFSGGRRHRPECGLSRSRDAEITGTGGARLPDLSKGYADRSLARRRRTAGDVQSGGRAEPGYVLPWSIPAALSALTKACQKFPDTPVVIDHLCRIGVSGRELNRPRSKALCDMAKQKNVTVKVSAFYAAGKRSRPTLIWAR